MAKPALGRGLGALLGGVPSAAKAGAASPAPAAATESPGAKAEKRDGVERVPLQRVHPCSFQPRKDFPPEALQELAQSIKEKGIVQPLLVRPKGEDFELIAGERRWRAAQSLGLSEVPVIIREADDRAVLELALIENLQRENLNPLEEALGYSQLVEQFNLKQEEVAVRVGKSRAAVANALRLLKLAPELQEHLRSGKLTVGHAKAILGLDGFAEQKRVASRIISEGLNVRQTEALVAQLQGQTPPPTGTKPINGAAAPVRDAHIVDIESRLKQRLGTKVSLRYSKGKGAVDIRFFSDDELERILQILGMSLD